MEESSANVIFLPGKLRVSEVPDAFVRIQKALEGGAVRVDFRDVADFDTAAVALLRYLRRCDPRLTVVNVAPALENAYSAFLEPSVPAACEMPLPTLPVRVLHSLSDRYVARRDKILVFLSLLGDEIFHTASYLRKRRGVYPGEIWNQLFFMGYKSFPIVLVLIFLVGVTITLMSAQQLKLYGATIYVADLVGLSMLRELVPLMTGIILSGKVGAAVAAELSTMTVLEEVDALKTMDVVPERFLMVPRLLAITLAVPLLAAMADVVGIGAGVIVGRLHLDILPSAFIKEMLTSVGTSDFLVGVLKTLVFGWVVIIGSGFKGMTVGRSAAEVGRATTESVVLSISLIVVIDCIFAFVIY